MKFYILNINYNGKSEVDFWLGERELAPIFYGQLKLTTIKEKIRVDEEIKKEAGYQIGSQAYADAKRFVDTFALLNEEAVIFSIGNEYVYIFKQAGPLYVDTTVDKRYAKDLVKCFKIKLLKRVKIKECPLVLVSIKANRFIQQGTFRDLNNRLLYLGNTKALEYVMSGQQVVVSGFAEYLQCLSSLEFETLVAKLLEESGLFVPAYKGGFLRNFDLFCKNVSANDVILDKTVLKPNAALSVQVKLFLGRKHKEILDRVDLFFCIKSEIKDLKICDWEYLENYLLHSPNTKKWLETDLNWVRLADDQSKH